MSQAERGSSSSRLVRQLSEPQVQPGGFWEALGGLERAFGREARQESYEGPLKEFFEREPLSLTMAEIVLEDGEKFDAFVDCFGNNEPGRENLRIFFLKPEIYQRILFGMVPKEGIFLNLSPKKLEVKRKVEKPETHVFEETPLFSLEIYEEQSLRGLIEKALRRKIQPNWSIRDVKAVPDVALVPVLNQLDPRKEVMPAYGSEASIKLEPVSLAAREIARLIGENLKALPPERPY